MSDAAGKLKCWANTAMLNAGQELLGRIIHELWCYSRWRKVFDIKTWRHSCQRIRWAAVLTSILHMALRQDVSTAGTPSESLRVGGCSPTLTNGPPVDIRLRLFLIKNDRNYLNIIENEDKIHYFVFAFHRPTCFFFSVSSPPRFSL